VPAADPPRYGRRRALAAGAVAVVGAAIGYGVHELTESPPPAPPQTVAPPRRPKPHSTWHGLVSGSFHSTKRGTEVGYTVSFPPHWSPGAAMPLCLVLHGYTATHLKPFDELYLQDPQRALASSEPPLPLVLAAADGGNGYWHPRADGDDPQGMLMEEFVPLVGRYGVNTEHVVAFGWSMGGYGALLLAETYRDGIQRVAVESPAIWPSFAASQGANPTAFDSPADWSAHDVIGHLPRMGSTPVRVACGLSDPFLPASRQLATLLPPGSVDLAPGGHDATFWRAHASSLLAFLAQ
jgi:enterochelin esterase-like enzyme